MLSSAIIPMKACLALRSMGMNNYWVRINEFPKKYLFTRK